MIKNNHNFLHYLSGEHAETSKKILNSIKAKADAKRTLSERIADKMTTSFGSMTFLILNLALFIFWLLVNTGKIEGIAVFDPFPFNLLTTIVSLEAIILAVFVLISQNRSMRVDDIREETHLQINLISEKEITKIMKMLAVLSEKNGINLSDDAELKKMLEPVIEEKIEEELEKEIL